MSSDLDDWEPMDKHWLAQFAAMPLHRRMWNDFSGSTVWTLAVEVQRLREANNRLSGELRRLRAEMQQVRLDHITALGELQEAAAEIEWLKEALTDAQNESRRG